MLPRPFEDLEPFASTWCLGTEPSATRSGWAARWPTCRRSTTPLSRRIEDALGYCDKFPLDDLPDDARRLLDLVHSTILVAMCVEIWHQPRVIDGADARLDRIAEPLPLTRSSAGPRQVHHPDDTG